MMCIRQQLLIYLCYYYPDFILHFLFLLQYEVNAKKSPAQAAFYVPPRMTKTEVKEYLTKIYEIPVLKVNTVNVLGNLQCYYACDLAVLFSNKIVIVIVIILLT